MNLSLIIPFRDRGHHLRRFLPNIESYLNRQRIKSEILIIEQESGKPFNRGKLLNIGFLKAKCQHVVFHDVDMIPQVGADYSPKPGANHMAGKASQFRYKMPYATYFGGVTMFDEASFSKINGFSNSYWGWGAEDDDLYFRAISGGINVTHHPFKFISLQHRRSIEPKLLTVNQQLLEQGTKDGLHDCEFVILREESISDSVKKITVSI